MSVKYKYILSLVILHKTNSKSATIRFDYQSDKRISSITDLEKIENKIKLWPIAGD